MSGSSKANDIETLLFQLKDRKVLSEWYFNGEYHWTFKKNPGWHDLRKNPNDLPKEAGYYLIIHENARAYKEAFILRYGVSEEEGHWLDDCHECFDNNVIAWHEIPKFEEETEC